MSDPRLAKCPCCGSGFNMSQEPHDNHPVAGMFYIYHEYGPIGSAARQCHLRVTGHFESAQAAIDWWDKLAGRQQQLISEVYEQTGITQVIEAAMQTSERQAFQRQSRPCFRGAERV